ncbi:MULTISPECIES: SDR family NAD(P)-dependent oxidoreductase [unclassified Nesterenkonia]|uniref:SDR family NAD(P)-dependent oxidoreductase n=1 Tax=unclassified Nesterenkonia TaxID=2629769 RepID=UPI001F4CFA58|nr:MULTISPECIES: SDR family NAD(P)-dependent oxidoreductase [unclassified Nesterenkonia]MCH8559259.1 SDR family NAD(P)-dependent oxidoreductase [Nesterenkonia sp. DZ6]MCH8571604.1 SDR family NAD(P)-dependent oxidoreductase [Nesterenkonia sp. AY15]
MSSGMMVGKTALVTGATAGIVKATAVGRARMGAHLAITGRDHGRTESPACEIRVAGRETVDTLLADLSSQREVRCLAEEVLQSPSRNGVLINNVGGYRDTRDVTVDGFAHTTGPIGFNGLQCERSYSGSRAYSQSKLAEFLFTYESARKLQGTLVTANALHPGVASTSATSIYVASVPDLEPVTSRFFAHRKPKRSSQPSYDEATADQLGRVSANLVGLPQ